MKHRRVRNQVFKKKPGFWSIDGLSLDRAFDRAHAEGSRRGLTVQVEQAK
ncbi:MAG: hypothetical protein GY847_04105 [Proteobacteria bacterium]|nr:hypothetical protein [Pseudomonadota bacterium]